MKVLVIGSGGREHALCAHFMESELVRSVMVTPGNAGMKETLPELKVENINVTDSEGLLRLALREKIDLTMVGPEASLESGVVDLFRANNLLIVGPTQKAAQVESSKSFAKKIMQKYGVPTADYQEFFEVEAALRFAEESPMQKMVVKCDGLAAGKGVVVCQNKNEARIAILSLMKEKLLGENTNHIIIEECLEGMEVSAFALCDGERFTFLGTASDHKRLRDNDRGPNTGGMGVFSPATIVSDEEQEWINQNVFSPMMAGMKKEGTPFSGILFAGLMKTKTGFKVLEFNARFGDPETQVLLPLLNEDLTPWLLNSAKGELPENKSIERKKMKAIHVVMAAHGYPGTEGVDVRSGDEIRFSKTFNLSPYDFLFFAGVSKEKGELKTKGGRVLGVTSLAETYTYARAKAYDYVEQIHFDGAQYRSDIGKSLV